MRPDPERTSGADMPPEEFRQWGHAAVDWMATYLAEVSEYPVLADVTPGALRDALPDRAPERGEEFSRILEDFEDLILPAITHWNHPSFHGYFAVTGSGPGILGEMLAATLNVNAMVWRSSPAGTELELQVVDWLRALVGLPDPFLGCIQDTASVGTFTALCAARHKAYPEVRRQGIFGLPRGCVYASEEAHSSVEKAVLALGLGQEGLRRIPTDRDFRMESGALREIVAEDVGSGLRPIAIVATVGTTSTSSVDPVLEISRVAESHDAWLHVDAAYAGASAVVPEFREHFMGWERASSVVLNPHKWLFTPVDCSVLLTSEPDVLKDSLSITPEYLRAGDGGEATNLMDFGLALGRRFRALKLWFVLRYFGAEGLRETIREHVRIARSLAARIDGAQGWRRVAPVPFSTVVFRYEAAGLSAEEGNALNLAIMEDVNESGSAFLTHTRLGDRVCIRLSVGNLRTEEWHVDRTWRRLAEAAARLSQTGARPSGAG